MKIKNLMKIWWIVALAFVLSGLVLVIVGWGLGANGSSVYIDSGGVHVTNDKDDKDFTVNDHNLDKFNGIDISTVSAEIELVPSDHFGLEARLPGESGKINWGVEDGQLTINAKQDWTDFSIFSFTFLPERQRFVKVFYPENTEFDKISLDSTSGSIAVAKTSVKNFNAKTVSGSIATNTKNSEYIKLKTTSGRIVMAADSQTSASVEVNSVSGSVVLENVVWNRLSVGTTSGRIEISGNATGQSNIKSVSGGVTVNLNNSLDTYDLVSTSGAIHVNGQRVGNPARIFSASSDTVLDVKTTSGKIDLNFEER